MLTEEKYLEVIESLNENLTECSDVVNAQIASYGSHFTSTGKWDNRKKGFEIKIMLGLNYLSGERIVNVMSNTFSHLNEWTNAWRREICFTDFSMDSVGGGNARLELNIFFDDLTSSVKKLLLR